MDWTRIITEYGPTIAIVGLFIWYLAYNRRACTACRTEQCELIKNHIGHSTDAMLDVARAVEKLATIIDERISRRD